MKGTTVEGGEIVQVEGGGHILRSTGRKDRHSKVYTSKGPRDRRVRLSAHTAIQFYDVQDRLGFDRPSKAVDWLIKKAKTAIDNLNEPPPWQPNDDSNQTPTTDSNPSSEQQYGLIQCDNNSSFMAAPPGKPFFPEASFPGFQAEDLGLSLQSFQLGENSLGNSKSFQGIEGWNGGGDQMDGRVGFGMNSQQAATAMFSDREILQSNLAVNDPWKFQASADEYNSQPRGAKSSDLESPFELGFCLPAPIYGEEEPDNHR